MHRADGGKSNNAIDDAIDIQWSISFFSNKIIDSFEFCAVCSTGISLTQDVSENCLQRGSRHDEEGTMDATKEGAEHLLRIYSS